MWKPKIIMSLVLPSIFTLAPFDLDLSLGLLLLHLSYQIRAGMLTTSIPLSDIFGALLNLNFVVFGEDALVTGN